MTTNSNLPIIVNPQLPARIRKQERLKDTAFFASWNVMGKLTTRAEMEILSRDMRQRKIAVCSLQETRNPYNAEIVLTNGDKFIFFGLQENGYGGLGFYISKDWVGHFQTTKRVTDRIVVARFQRLIPPTSPQLPADPVPSPGVFSRTRQRSSLTQLEQFFQPTVLRAKTTIPTQTTQSNQNNPSLQFIDQPPRVSDLRGDIVIINVYSYPSDKAKKFPKQVCELYDTLRTTYARERAGSDLVLVMGDFNAKIGMRSPTETEIMGEHGKGTRNDNGTTLANFLHETNLFAVNTYFKHRPMQKATWHGGNPARKSKNPHRANVGGLHNMIDFILAPKRMLTLFSDARAYMPCLFTHRSDHSMVVASVLVGRIYKLPRTHRRTVALRDHRVLSGPKSEEIRKKFQENVENQIHRITQREESTGLYASAETFYSDIKNALNAAADATLPLAPRRVNEHVKYLEDPTLSQLSKSQQRLSQRIYGKASNRNDRKVRRLRERRQQLFHQIRDRRRALEQAHIDRVAQEIQSSHDTRAIFEFTRILQKNTSKRLTLVNEDGNELRSAGLKIQAVTNFYSSFFQRAGHTPLPEWRGEARPLANPITSDEVKRAAARLRNNRATPDGLRAEFLKYGGDRLHETLADLFNSVFTEHMSIPEWKEGILIAVNKPAPKKALVENTRPIALLNSYRKLLTLIVQNRILPRVLRYLPLSQHAYLPRRSSGELLWTLQFIRSIAERYGERFVLLQTDLEKAFDSPNRSQLMAILEESGCCTEDDLRIIQFLLADTKLRARVESHLGPFFTTLSGIPQGDVLSAILFIIYFAYILDKADTSLSTTSTGPQDVPLTYADDHYVAFRESANDIALRERLDTRIAALIESGELETDTHPPECNCVNCCSHRYAPTLSEYLTTYSMRMDPAKTRYREITNKTASLGRVLGYDFEYEVLVKSRKRNADLAFASLNKLWFKGIAVSEKRKLRIYTATVLPHFIHTGGAVILRQVDLDQLDARHRHHLRRLLGVFYPETISSQALYIRTKTQPVSILLLQARWRLLGHILRGDKNLPAYQIMLTLLARRGGHSQPVKKPTWKGGKKKLLHKALQEDLNLLDEDMRTHHFCVLEFKDHHDLVQIRERAQDRDRWKESVQALIDAAMAKWTERDTHIIERQRRAQERLAEREARRLQPRRPKPHAPNTKQAKRREASESKTYAAGQTRGGGKGPRKLKPSTYQKPTEPRSSSSTTSAFFAPRPKPKK